MTKREKPEFKLAIELVPQTSWYDNLREVLPTAEWDRIRKRAYADCGHRCGVCGKEGRLNCHELWEYDDEKRIQKLMGSVALCDLCHHVKHIGLAGVLASRGQLDYEKVVEHFKKVNGCDQQAFEEHRKEAFDVWRKRSQHEWHVDLGEYKDVIEHGSAT